MNHKEYFRLILDIAESLLEMENVKRVKKLSDLVHSELFWKYVEKS